MSENENPLQSESFNLKVKIAKEKLGKELLTDDDLLILSVEEMSHTFTYGEQGYK